MEGVLHRGRPSDAERHQVVLKEHLQRQLHLDRAERRRQHWRVSTAADGATQTQRRDTGLEELAHRIAPCPRLPPGIRKQELCKKFNHVDVTKSKSYRLSQLMELQVITADGR